jgi:hypothetical protein
LNSIGLLVEYNQALRRGLTASVNYLLRLQAPTGAWTDFWLPVGASDAWATAFVGLGLHAASESHLLDPQVREAALAGSRRAAAWLLAQPRSNGGWGYNGQVAADADSTAHCLSLLAHLGVPAPREAIAFLLASRTVSGFRTYAFPNPQHAWTHPCSDVTAAALRALFDLGRFSQAELAAEWVNLLGTAQGLDGLWNGYWWISPSYPTGLVLEVWAQAGRPLLHRPVCLRQRKPSVFDQAWALQTHALLGEEQAVHRLAGWLLTCQESDGGWPSAPVLRVPSSQPGVSVRDDLQGTDARRLFATASALRALALHAPIVIDAPPLTFRRPLPANRSVYHKNLTRLVQSVALSAGFNPSAAQQARRLVNCLTSRSLAYPCPFPSAQLSTLADGLPVEFSVNVGPTARPALRCAAEVGDPFLAPYPRALSALESIAQVAHMLDCDQAYERILPGIRQVVSPELPVPEAARFWVWGGLDITQVRSPSETLDPKVFPEQWIAPAGNGISTLLPVLKVYLNLLDTELGGGGRARLERALAAVSIPIPPAVREALDRLDAVGFLHELGFGLGKNGRVALKLYYELHGWRRALVGNLLTILDLPIDPDAVVPEIPGILRESLAAKCRAGISLRLDPDSGAARELTIAAAFPPPMLTPQETTRRIAAWIESLSWDSTPYRALANLLLPDWQAEDAASAVVTGHLRMHSLFTRTISAEGPEATIYLRPWVKVMLRNWMR